MTPDWTEDESEDGELRPFRITELVANQFRDTNRLEFSGTSFKLWTHILMLERDTSCTVLVSLTNAAFSRRLLLLLRMNDTKTRGVAAVLNVVPSGTTWHTYPSGRMRMKSEPARIKGFVSVSVSPTLWA